MLISSKCLFLNLSRNLIIDMIRYLIQDLVSNNIKLSVALKKSKLILSIIEEDKLKSFIKNELEGYSFEETPEYRILSGNPIGTYRHNFNGNKTNIPLDLSRLSEQLMLDFNSRRINSSIIEIEATISQSRNNTGDIFLEFTPDQLSLLRKLTNAGDDNGWYLEKAGWVFGQNTFEQIYSQTEHKLLELLLDIDKKNPELNLQLQYMEDKEEKKQSINTTINGNIISSPIGIGLEVTQKEISISYNQDIESLIQAILNLGFEKADTLELQQLLDEQKKSGNSNGKKILEWTGKLASKAIEKGIEFQIPQLMKLVSNYF